MDLKKYAGKEVVVQFKGGEAWLLWAAPPKQAGTALPQIVQLADQNGDMRQPPLPFIQGKVTEDGEVLVSTGQGGLVGVAVEPSTIASVTWVAEFATVTEPSRLIVPGN